MCIECDGEAGSSLIVNVVASMWLCVDVQTIQSKPIIFGLSII